MMPRDPHDPASRRQGYAKDEREEALLWRLNAVLQQADLPLARPSVPPESLPIVYIVGVPRSGGTVLSQLVSRYLPLGYINNFIARFWLRPSVGIHLYRTMFDESSRNEIALRSTHGVSDGIHGPHEFGYFWRYWFQLDRSPTHHLTAEALDRLEREGLKQGLQHALEQELLNSFGRGVVFKNVICGFQARFLTELHPRSLFVLVRRDALEVAASILNCRQQRYGSYESWWSLKPSTYPFHIAPSDPAAQVAQQVLDCQTEFEQELSSPGVHTMEIQYEGLCENPAAALQAICTRLQSLDVDVKPITTAIPALTVSRPPRLEAVLEARLSECIDPKRAGVGRRV
jgi:hypothetical protein